MMRATQTPCSRATTQGGGVLRSARCARVPVQRTQCAAQSRQSDNVEGGQRRIAFLASSVAALTLVTSPAPCMAEPLYQAGPSEYAYPAAERFAEQEEKRFDENLQTRELKDLLSLLEKGAPKASELEAARAKVGFQRAVDGRVSLKGPSDRHWYSIKNDMQSPGFILARDQNTGRVYFLPPDESGRLMQIDLSDDVVVGQLFGSGAWQDVLELLKAEDVSGNIVPLVLDESEFRNTLSLLEDAVEQQ